MNLSKLIHEVWSDSRVRELNIKKSEVKVIMEVMIDHIIVALITERKLKIHGLFTLIVKKAKGRKIANPQSGEHMYSRDYYKVKIEPSKRLKENLEDME